VEAVARKLVGRDIIPDVASLCGLAQQVSKHVSELLLRSGHLLVSMQERREVGIVVPAGLVGDDGVGLEHGFEPLASSASPVPDFGEMFEVAGDLTFVPGEQDRFDVRELLVQRRASDAGLLGDPRHRHRPQPVLGHQRPGGLHDRLMHRTAVRLDRIVPQSRHHLIILDGNVETY
jgi:hypothetical protein